VAQLRNLFGQNHFSIKGKGADRLVDNHTNTRHA
jgi:hypothetical protein